jgi:malonate transporter
MDFINSIAPLFSIIFIGFFCGKKQLLNEKQNEGFEYFLFKVAIPCFLFSTIMKTSIKQLIHWPYVFNYLLSFTLLACVIFIIFRAHCNVSHIAIRILASLYVNAAFYSIPVLFFVLGDSKAAVIINVLQVAVIQLIFVFLLGVTTHEKKAPMRSHITHALSNPIIILPIIGMVLSYLEITIPIFLGNTITSIGSGAAALALFSFGMSLSAADFGKATFTKDLAIIVGMKNFIHPIVALIMGYYLFGLERYWLIATVIMTAAPTAIIIHFISKRYDTDSRLVRNTVATTSVISLLSIMLIYALMDMF